MATQDFLPEPRYTIDLAGGTGGTGVSGPGFSAFELESEMPIMKAKLNSGRLDNRFAYHHKWKAKISYNSLTRDEFNTVYPFLMYHKISMLPFYMALPVDQINYSRDIVVASAGDTQITLNKTAGGADIPENYYLHLDGKMYKINRITSTGDTNTDVEDVNITPPLIAPADFLSTVSTDLISIAVKQVGESLKYSIDSKNLYSFSFNVEEVV